MKLINHYLKWCKFKATKDSSCVKPVVEWVESIEVNPLPYILMAKDIKEEVWS
jgi:hypothetical protein